MARVVILGAGGHAQVVADILLRAAEAGSSANPVAYLDDNRALYGRVLLGLPVLGSLAELDSVEHDAVIVGIGDNEVRRGLYRVLAERGEQFAIARHPAAVLAPDTQVGPGTMICAGVVVNTGSVIGADTILNTGCTVDHHNRVKDHAHIAPGVHLGGEVLVDEGALVGIGATVMPRCSLGAWSTVGAGACVTQPVPSGVTVVGIPARPIRNYLKRAQNHGIVGK
jgi:sugar O-acyltransferase (sialic acid O-acetyltransferase NeuD family)